MSVKILKSNKITHASQDENKKFFFLLVCIYVNNITLSPALIYKDDSGSLQDIWFED